MVKGSVEVDGGECSYFEEPVCSQPVVASQSPVRYESQLEGISDFSSCSEGASVKSVIRNKGGREKKDSEDERFCKSGQNR
jgi:hypothetical protein